MLTRDGARLQVLLDLRARYGYFQGQQELIILDEETIERPWGWVFFYTSRGWKNGDERYAVGGNAPYMVNKRDGTLRHAGTAKRIEDYILDYEAELERQAGAWDLFINEPSDCKHSIASGIRSVLGLSIPEIGEFKKRLPCVWASGARVDLEPVCKRLIDAGVHAEVRRADHSDSP